jgi:hypothetical protein
MDSCIINILSKIQIKWHNINKSISNDGKLVYNYELVNFEWWEHIKPLNVSCAWGLKETSCMNHLKWILGSEGGTKPFGLNEKD